MTPSQKSNIRARRKKGNPKKKRPVIKALEDHVLELAQAEDAAKRALSAWQGNPDGATLRALEVALAQRNGTRKAYESQLAAPPGSRDGSQRERKPNGRPATPLSWEDSLKPGDLVLGMRLGFLETMHCVQLGKPPRTRGEAWQAGALCGFVSKGPTWLPIPRVPFKFMLCEKCMSHPEFDENVLIGHRESGSAELSIMNLAGVGPKRAETLARTTPGAKR
jgi:hypothetical protein